MTAVLPDSEEQRSPRGDRALRAVWWVVSTLAAIVLLAVVAVASTAILSPDAFVNACNRPQLLTPLSCGGEAP